MMISVVVPYVDPVLKKKENDMTSSLPANTLLV